MAKDDYIDPKNLNVIQNLFGIKPKPQAQDIEDKIQLIKTRTNPDNSIEDLGPVKFDPRVEYLYKLFLERAVDMKKYKNFNMLLDDMQELYVNDSLNNRATNLIADETVQADTNMQPIFVEASKKQKDFLLNFMDVTGINKSTFIRRLAFNIIKNGNAGLTLGMDKTGINELISIKPKKIEGRLEFTPAEVETEIEANLTFKTFTSLDRVKQLVDTMNQKDQTTSEFKKYLIGFQVDGKVLPPWRFIHFRNLVDDSEFEPFGTPLFIHALAPYKNWFAGETFRTLAMSLNFPIEKHTLALPGSVDPAEQLKRLRTFINQIDALGIVQSNKEERALGDRVFCIKDVYNYELITPGIDLGNMENSEQEREERIIATRLPRFIIDENDGGFGEGGTTLVQKWKEFARLIFQIQSIILEGITQICKIHMIASGEFKLEDIDFILSMPFPESKNSDVVETQSNLVSLANEIFDVLSDRILDGDPLPPEVVGSVLNQLNIFDQKVIDMWIDETEKTMGKDEEFNENIGADRGRKKLKKLKEKIGRYKLNEMIGEIIYEGKQKVLREGVLSGKHYFSSKIKNEDFNASFLRTSNIDSIKKLSEKEKFTEEIKCEKYTFTFDKNYSDTNKKRR